MIHRRLIGSMSKPKTGNAASAVSAILLLNPLLRILNLRCRNWQELDRMTRLYVDALRHRSVLRLIPDLRFGLRSERHKAIRTGLVFLAAFAVTIVNSLWAATLFLLALLAGI
jgi:hypothetical protein